MSQQYKVLVVDDDLKLRSLLERYLTEQGFVVRGVANGEQADRLHRAAVWQREGRGIARRRRRR